MTIPEGMTAAKLRKIAAWLDTMDRLAERYYELLEAAGFTESEKIAAAREVTRGKDIQADLRRWADEL